MKIKSVEMTNVKCYSHGKFDFENGINFISGINGAGKTSIIESIGFALFNYKVGGKSRFNSYFIKRGEKKASVRLIFQDKSNKDYIVERKITTSSNNSWIIKDIDTEEEIVSGEEDVSNWLKDNLGFYRDDNISDIFENIISVPQGMFTSAFLDTAQNRKNKFDPIFKLEVYRKIYGNSLMFENGLRNKKTEKEKEQTMYETKKEILERDQAEYKELKKQIAEIKKLNTQKEKRYKEIDKIYTEKKKIKDEINKVTQAIELGKVKEENEKVQIENFEKDLKIAKEAQKVLKENEAGYEEYLKEDKKQNELKIMKKQFDTLNENKKSLKVKIEQCNTVIEMKIENKKKINSEINILKDETTKKEEKIKEQENQLSKQTLLLEQAKQDVLTKQELENKIVEKKNQIDTNKVMQKNINKDIKRLEKTVDNKKNIIDEKDKLKKLIETKDKIHDKKKQIEDELSKMTAKYEQLKESKKIASAGVCPYLKTECINVKGKTEEEYEQEIKEVSEQIVNIRLDKKQIETDEKKIIKAEAELKNVESKLEEVEFAEKDMLKLKDEIKENEEKIKKAESDIFNILKENGIEQKLENIVEFKKLVKKNQNEFSQKDTEYNVYKTKLENAKKEYLGKVEQMNKNKEELDKIEADISEQNDNIKKYSKKVEEMDAELKKFETLEEQMEANEKNCKKQKWHITHIFKTKRLQKRQMNLKKFYKTAKIIYKKFKMNYKQMQKK